MTDSLATPVDAKTLLDEVLTRAKAAGADAADVVFARSTSLTAAVRLGETELVERSEAIDLGLRVIVGKKQACISASDVSPAALAAMIERVMGMVSATPDDPYCGLAEPAQLAKDWKLPDLADPTPVSADTLIRWAHEVEAAALAVAGVTNTEGSSASWEEGDIAMAASNGFFAGYHETGGGFSVTALAGEGTAMEQDAVYEHRRFAADLPSLAEAGRKAGERAVRKLNPRKGPTKTVPVVFAPEQASGLLMDFASAINGAAIARGTSFLKERMGQAVFGSGITVVNDPGLPRGLRSRAFDGEGLPVQRRVMVDKGVLQGWFLDLRSARQLKLSPTGDAGRGIGAPPSPSASNLWIEPGALAPEALLAEIKEGLYVTDIIGHGLNLVTGDYSRGVMGFWIENGQLAYPVSEMTVAGNLKDMFMGATVASDLTRRYGIDAPTMRIEKMTVAGV